MKRFVCVLLAAALLTVAGCTAAPAGTETGTSMSVNADESWTAQLKSADGFQLIAQDSVSELLINAKTTEVAVRNKADGSVWYSMPADRKNDTVAAGGDADMLNAPFTFSYLDTSKRVLSASAYEQSIALDQYAFEKIDNGIRIYYTVGEKPKKYLVPEVITKERMEELCAKLDEFDAQMLMAYYRMVSLDDIKEAADRLLYIEQYPALEDHDVYVLSGLTMGNQEYPEFLLVTLQEYFEKAGYTHEQLAEDNKINKIEDKQVTDYSIAVTMEYTLDNGDLIVRIPTDSMVYDKKVMTVTTMTLLPFFGAAGTQDAGYMMVPDGCGALIDLNSNKTGVTAYSKAVYGIDQTLAPEEADPTDVSQIYLPVFGLKANERAFLGIIESGAAYANINANVSGRRTSYNQVYTSYTLRAGMTQTDSVLNITGSQLFQKDTFPDDIQLRFKFLSGEKADYVGMANCYGDYLESTGALTVAAQPQDHLAFHLAAIGAVSYTRNVLGIPVTAAKRLTSYEQAKTMLQSLQDAGVSNIQFSYTGWANGGVDNTAPRAVKLLSALGGKKGFSALTDYINAQNIAFYPDLEMQYVKQYKKGFNVNKQSSRDLSNMIAYRYAYSLATLQRDESEKQAIISPSAYDRLTDGFLKDLHEWKLNGISFGSSGTQLNSDFNEKKTVTRQQVSESVRTQMAKFNDAGYRTAVDGANAYALKGVSLVKEMPSSSSGNYMFDRDVPFYQIVLHGRVPFTSEPLNMSGRYEQDVLKLAETGAIPCFKWIYENNLELKDTDSSFYSVNYSSWKDEAIALYQKLDAAFGNCANAKIVGHTAMMTDVYRTVYDNGVTVYTNYTKQSVSVDGHTVAAGDFSVIKEGAQ